MSLEKQQLIFTLIKHMLKSCWLRVLWHAFRGKMCNEHYLIIFFVHNCKGKKNFTVHVVQVCPSNCCSHESLACSNLAKYFTAEPQTAPALQQKGVASVYHNGVTLVVYIPKEQWRVTGVCVQYKVLSARQVWVRLSRKQQAKFKLHLKNCWDLNT